MLKGNQLNPSNNEIPPTISKAQNKLIQLGASTVSQENCGKFSTFQYKILFSQQFQFSGYLNHTLRPR